MTQVVSCDVLKPHFKFVFGLSCVWGCVCAIYYTTIILSSCSSLNYILRYIHPMIWWFYRYQYFRIVARQMCLCVTILTNLWPLVRVSSIVHGYNYTKWEMKFPISVLWTWNLTFHWLFSTNPVVDRAKCWHLALGMWKKVNAMSNSSLGPRPPHFDLLFAFTIIHVIMDNAVLYV